MTGRKKLEILVALLTVPALFYVLDYLSVIAGVPSRPRYATFTINRFYRVDEKFNKYYFEPLAPVQEQCVNALFPHFGSRPCWYVSRHTMQAVEPN